MLHDTTTDLKYEIYLISILYLFTSRQKNEEYFQETDQNNILLICCIILRRYRATAARSSRL